MEVARGIAGCCWSGSTRSSVWCVELFSPESRGAPGGPTACSGVVAMVGLRLVHPIAAPAARPRRGVVSAGRSCALCPPTSLMLFGAALSHTGPPIEEGERCHICDLPAVVEQVHIAWCSTCACALFAWRNLYTLGPADRAAYSDHALDHAFRWHRVVRRLLGTRAWRGYPAPVVSAR